MIQYELDKTYRITKSVKDHICFFCGNLIMKGSIYIVASIKLHPRAYRSAKCCIACMKHRLNSYGFELP